jgi:hypothetical protein
VGQLAKDGKSLDELKKDLRMPEVDHWQGKSRFPKNIEAAYRADNGILGQNKSGIGVEILSHIHLRSRL